MLAALFALGFAYPNTSSAMEFNAPIKIERNCAVTFTAAQTRPLVVDVWRHVRWQRGQPKPATIRVYRKRLKCAAGPGHRKAVKRRWRKAKRAFYQHRAQKRAELRRQRRLDALTPYGAYAIPTYIVQCESGGDFNAYNAGYEPHGPGSGPGGAYQIIAQTWAGYGGLEFAPTAVEASPEEQHIVAGRIWAEEGSSPWECA